MSTPLVEAAKAYLDTMLEYYPQGPNKKVHDAVRAHAGYEIMHIGSQGHHHVYLNPGEAGDEGDHLTYYHHNEKTGKTHEFQLPDKKVKLSDVKKHLPADTPHKLAVTLHKDHNYSASDFDK